MMIINILIGIGIFTLGVVGGAVCMALCAAHRRDDD